MSTKKREHSHTTDHARHTHTRETPTEPPAPVIEKLSDDERYRSIQLRAYGLSERAGKPDGDSARVKFWCEAEKEITSSPRREA